MYKYHSMVIRDLHLVFASQTYMRPLSPQLTLSHSSLLTLVSCSTHLGSRPRFATIVLRPHHGHSPWRTLAEPRFRTVREGHRMEEYSPVDWGAWNRLDTGVLWQAVTDWTPGPVWAGMHVRPSAGQHQKSHHRTVHIEYSPSAPSWRQEQHTHFFICHFGSVH